MTLSNMYKVQFSCDSCKSQC